MEQNSKVTYVLLVYFNNEVTSKHISPSVASLECSQNNMNSWTFIFTTNIAFPMIIKISKKSLNAVEMYYFSLSFSNGFKQKTITKTKTETKQ